MYKCFESIPIEKRQEAFDFIVKLTLYQCYRYGDSLSEERNYHYRPPSVYVPGQWHNKWELEYDVDYCPLGALNHVLGIAPNMIADNAAIQGILTKTNDNIHLDSYSQRAVQRAITMPCSGALEALVLATLGVESNARSLARFISRNDSGEFAYYYQLADAMGVEDTCNRIYTSRSYLELVNYWPTEQQ